MSSKGLPEQCCICSIPISPENPAIIQICSCLLALCRGCAKFQFVDRKGTFRSYIECFACKARTDAATGIISNIPEAIKYENALVQRVFQFCGVTIPRTFSVERYGNDSLNSATLDICRASNRLQMRV